jgi:hypothetical protein
MKAPLPTPGLRSANSGGFGSGCGCVTLCQMGFPQDPARTLLARHGVAAIWLLHLAAARAYQDGNPDAAVSVIEIADAAEREWLRGVGPDRC